MCVLAFGILCMYYIYLDLAYLFHTLFILVFYNKKFNEIEYLPNQ